MPIEWWRHSGRGRLLPPRARLRLPRPRRPAGELRLQRERRPLPPARLDVRLAARDRVHARRRAAPARRDRRRRASPQRSAVVCGRRPALDVLALVDRRARGRAASSSRSRWRRWWPLAAAVVVVAGGLGFASIFHDIAPRTHWFASDLPYQEAQAKAKGPLPKDSGLKGTVSIGEPSIKSHWESLEGGDPNGHAPPPGLRARQRRHDRSALRREDRGGRVELHRARRRDRDRRGAPVHRLEPGPVLDAAQTGLAGRSRRSSRSPPRSPPCSRSRSKPMRSGCPGSRTVCSGSRGRSSPRGGSGPSRSRSGASPTPGTPARPVTAARVRRQPTVARGPDIEGVGRFSVITDPTGAAVGSTRERELAEPRRDVGHALEARAGVAAVADQLVEHRDPVAAPDHLRVHADRRARRRRRSRP